MRSESWNRYYPFQVWLITLLTAAVINGMLPIGKNSSFSSGFGIFFFFFYFGLIYSIPIFIIYLLVFLFIRKKLSELQTKTISCITGFILSVLAYGISDLNLPIILIFGSPLVTTSFLFKIKNRPQ
jgi:hypothetical protein